MTDDPSRIVSKLWSFCQVLRDDGLSYQDYLEQLTFLLFLKMAEEKAELTEAESVIPVGYRWGDLCRPDVEGARLEEHYRDTLKRLGEAGGMLGLIFRKAQNKIQDPAKLRQLIVELIDRASPAGSPTSRGGWASTTWGQRALPGTSWRCLPSRSRLESFPKWSGSPRCWRQRSRCCERSYSAAPASASPS